MKRNKKATEHPPRCCGFNDPRYPHTLYRRDDMTDKQRRLRVTKGAAVLARHAAEACRRLPARISCRAKLAAKREAQEIVDAGLEGTLSREGLAKARQIIRNRK